MYVFFFFFSHDPLSSFPYHTVSSITVIQTHIYYSPTITFPILCFPLFFQLFFFLLPSQKIVVEKEKKRSTTKTHFDGARYDRTRKRKSLFAESFFVRKAQTRAGKSATIKYDCFGVSFVRATVPWGRLKIAPNIQTDRFLLHFFIVAFHCVTQRAWKKIITGFYEDSWESFVHRPTGAHRAECICPRSVT